MYSFSYLLAFFMFYAFAGWCTEVIYKTTCTGKFVNRGFLNGPLCPIYGVGVTVVIVCLTPLQDNLLVLYVGSVILTSLLEFITGFVLEKIFHQKWWDYTNDAFNIMGYVCLKFSLGWGFACVFVMKIIQPIVLNVIEITPPTVRLIIFIIFYTLMAADGIITIAALAKIKFQLQIANDLDHMLNKIAEAVGTRLSSGTLKSMNELQEQKELLEEFKEKASDIAENQKEKISEFKENSKNHYKAAAEKSQALESKYTAFSSKAKAKFGENFNGTEKLSFVHKRLEKAYPSLKLERIEDKNINKNFATLKTKLEEFTERIGNMKM